MARHQIFGPAVTWTCICGACTLFVHAVRCLLARLLPSLGGAVCRAQRGPGWLRCLWSTLYVFAVCVPFFVFLVMMVLSGLLAASQGWSYPDGFHYHAYTLGLTRKNLGSASDPQSIAGDVLNLFVTLTGSISMYVILGMAGMTSLARRLTDHAPQGVLGLVRSIFLYYPLAVLLIAGATAAGMCALEGWPYADSFLMACGWFCGVSLDIGGRRVSSDEAMFLITLCHIIAVAMKLTVCNLVYANTFPQRVAEWIDGTAAPEPAARADVKGAPRTPGDGPAADCRDAAALQAECWRLQVENQRLRDENVRLQRSASGIHDAQDVEMLRVPGIVPSPQCAVAGRGGTPSSRKLVWPANTGLMAFCSKGAACLPHNFW